MHDGGDNNFRVFLRTLQRHPSYRAFRQNWRATKRLLPNVWRMATHRQRQLPGAVVVGAQKAGTTQLYACLIRHPRCFHGLAKETQYFSKRADRPLRWYQSRFPLARRVQAVDGICIEASPSYLPSPDALRRMHNVLPEAKVIVLLRDPVSRAFSHYQHCKTRRLESRSFAEAVGDAITAHPATPDRGWFLRPEAEPLLNYVARGYYALQIEVLWHLYPREQVLILDSADLFNDTNAVCQRVFDFLGLDRCDVQPQKIYNRGYYRETIDPATAQRLRDHYQPHNELLVDLTGRRFRWMDSEGESATNTSAAA